MNGGVALEQDDAELAGVAVAGDADTGAGLDDSVGDRDLAGRAAQVQADVHGLAAGDVAAQGAGPKAWLAGLGAGPLLELRANPDSFCFTPSGDPAVAPVSLLFIAEQDKTSLAGPPFG